MLASPLLRTEKISHRLASRHVWGLTLVAVVQLYIAKRSSCLSNPMDKTLWQSTLVSYESPIIGKLSIAAFELDAILRILRPRLKLELPRLNVGKGCIRSLERI